MSHTRIELGHDDEHELSVERCDCGQYSLSIGAVTVQVEADSMQALQRLLNAALSVDDDAYLPTASAPGDVQ